MEIRQKLGRLRRDFNLKGEVALQRPEITQAAMCVLRFLLAFTLARAEVFGGYTPFGVAIVAVSGAGVAGFLAFCGVILGSYLGGDFVWGLKYAAMAVLVYAASFVFQDLRVYKKRWFMPVVAAFMAACTGFVYAQDAGWSVAATVFFLTETVLVGGGAYFFRIALSGSAADAERIEGGAKNGATGIDPDMQRAVSTLVLIGACLIALTPVTIFAGISVGRLIAVFIVMSTAYRSGVGAGSATGAALGLAMDAALGGVPFFSMAYAFSGLLSGVFSRHGKFSFVISFVLANAVAVLWTWNSVLHIAALYEVFAVSMLFLIVPTRALAKCSVTMDDVPNHYGDAHVKAHAQKRMERLGTAFAALHETLRGAVLPRNDNDVATIFDRAADVCCRACVSAPNCWHRDYESTVDVMNNATIPMLERGKLKKDDFPPHFAKDCGNLEKYIAAVNEELRARTYRRQFQSRLRQAQGAIGGQYRDMGELLAGLAKELETDLTHEPIRERKLRRYLRSRNVEADTAVFRDRNGRLHAEITSKDLTALRQDKDNLDKLSVVLGVRLCEKRQQTPSKRAAGGTISVMEAEPLAAAVGIASVRKKGQGISGDKGTYFKTDDGRLYVILSDGMGTGESAAGESGSVVAILEQFLKAGLRPESAMKLVNSAIQAKNAELSACATIDLMCVNLFTGQAQLFKYGAAPSFVKRGRAVRGIRGESFAAGLTRGQPDVMNIHLAPGNFSVIISDGILPDNSDKWLSELIAAYTGTDAKELARCIVENAVNRFGSEDDMTVLTVFLEERG